MSLIILPMVLIMITLTIINITDANVDDTDDFHNIITDMKLGMSLMILIYISYISTIFMAKVRRCFIGVQCTGICIHYFSLLLPSLILFSFDRICGIVLFSKHL